MEDIEEGGGRGVGKKTRRKYVSNKIVSNLKDFMIQKGWRKRYLDKHFKSLSDFEIDQESFEYYTTNYAHMWFDEQDDFSEKSLYNIGLYKTMSHKLFYVIEPLLNTCYTNEQLLDCCLEYILGKYSPLTSVDTKYFLESIPENVWIKHDDYGYCCNISYGNSNEYVDYEHLTKVLSAVEKDDYTLFYHCTNWTGTLNIIKHGPVSHFGRKCLDFGITPSFYSTPDINVAMSWGFKSKRIWGHEVAILVFRVSNKILESGVKAYKVKYFNDVDNEWKKLTTDSRRCQMTMNDLDNYNLIYGPMLANVNNIHLEEARAHKPIKYQLAAKKTKTEQYFRKNFIGTIWFDKQNLSYFSSINKT